MPPKATERAEMTRRVRCRCCLQAWHTPKGCVCVLQRTVCILKRGIRLLCVLTGSFSNTLVRTFLQKKMSGRPELWLQDFLLSAVHSSTISIIPLSPPHHLFTYSARTALSQTATVSRTSIRIVCSPSPQYTCCSSSSWALRPASCTPFPPSLPKAPNSSPVMVASSSSRVCYPLMHARIMLSTDYPYKASLTSSCRTTLSSTTTSALAMLI